MRIDSVKLKDICNIQSGGTPRRGVAEYYNGKIPWAKISDLNTEDGYIYSTEELISDKGLEIIGNRIFPTGTLLLAMYGSVGKTALAGIDLSTNQAILGIQIKDQSKIDIMFLKHWFSSFQEQLVNRARGVTLQNISASIVKELKIPLPPLQEQKRIAAMLDRADALRRKRQESLLLLDELLRSVFLEMFGDPVKNTKGWEVRSIKSISKRFSDGPFGSNLKTEHYTSSGIRVIRLQNIGIARFIDDDKVYISTDYYSKVLKKYTCLPGDIVIGTMGDPNLRACIIPEFIENAINKADCIQCRTNMDTALPEYICNLLNLKQTLSLASNMIHGQTRGRISMGQLSSLQIPIPPISIQKEFSNIVKKIKRKQTLFERSLGEMEQGFDSMMQRAFRGEL